MTPANKDKAVAMALDRMRAELADADIPARCPGLGLPEPRDGILDLEFLDQTLSLNLETLAFEANVDAAGQVLILRYLCRERPLMEEGLPLAYRELPGASFYVGPFKARSTTPLAAALDEGLDGLARAMAAYRAQPTGRGDASWRVSALGKIWLELICYAPDEEFPASCGLLFSPAVPRVYSPDEAAMLGSLFCLGLVRRLASESGKPGSP